MKIATWNVNSVRARGARLVAWLERHRPDVLCLQETKVPDEDFPIESVQSLGYHAVLHGQKSYNGVAILSRTEPSDVCIGFCDGVDDAQCRLIRAKVGGVVFLSAYFPNGGEVGSDKWTYKLAWMKRLRAYLDRDLRASDPIALCGDFNVAPNEDDVARPRAWAGSVLTHDDARDALANIAGFGLLDLFRPFHPDGGVYSWWDYRAGSFERGDGLRIDHVFGSAPLAQRCIGAIVDHRERTGDAPSDHAPVVVQLR